MKKVLVYGWYHQGNIGDDLFIEAFYHLFPDYQFIFTDSISADKLTDIDAVFFGGGSFLLDRPNVTTDAWETLVTKKIFYLGVGVESDIHPKHQELMSRAILIATRSSDQVERLRNLNPNAKLIPDLVYSLRPKLGESSRISRSVLVMTNISVVPSNSDPHWKHASWAYFKSEFGQFLDWLIEADYRPKLFSMCRGLNLSDDWASAELVSSMNRRSRNRLSVENPVGIDQVSRLVAKHEVVITQRFHGIVLAELTRTPYIAIHHHDKLKSSQLNEGSFLSYYNSSKQSYIDAFVRTMKMNFTSSLPIESTIFETFAKEVANLI
jgi:polysaccharide pyruvyl transferase WcaK-like protein